MEFAVYVRFAAALALVIALIAGASWIVRRFGLAGAAPLSRGPRRLSLVETLPIDTKRRLILVQKDDKEHLILLGPTGDTLIESGPQKAERP